jgi:hypothetical protein
MTSQSATQTKKSTPSSRSWTLTFAALVMLATTLPYLLGFATQGEGWRFSGFVFGVEDGNSYIAKMLAGMAGDWLFRTPYSAQPQGGMFAYLPYLLLGKLAAPPGAHEQLVALFQLFRIAAGMLAILATDDFLSLFVPARNWRRLGLALITVGGGLGWVPALLGRAQWLGSLPLEFYSPESFGFLSLYGLPHLALARALLLWGLSAYLGENGKGARAGLLWLLLGLMQPLTVVVAWIVTAAHLSGLALWQMARRQAGGWGRWQSFARRAVWAMLLSSPLVIYTAIVFSVDPFFRLWAAQNLILSPHPLHYLLAYGVLLPFAFGGTFSLLRENPWQGWLPIIWALLLPFLAYAPYNLQRRLPEGIWAAIVVLGIKGMERWGEGKQKNRGAVFVAFLLFPSSLLLLAGGLMTAARPSEPVFQPAAQVSAFRFLAEHARPAEVVLAAYETGNALPAWAPLRVVIGHGPESVGLAELQPRVAAFFRIGSSDSEHLTFLQEMDVKYIFWGPAERALGDWHPANAPYLRLVFQEEEVAILAVAP